MAEDKKRELDTELRKLIGGIRGIGNPGRGKLTIEAAKSIKAAQTKAREEIRKEFGLGDGKFTNPEV